VPAAEFTPRERALLDRFAPRLQYDPQDAYRAVAAQTMTDNPPNLLQREDGAVIAAAPELGLATLAGYPDGLAFLPGDHLAAGPDMLGDAVRMQADPRYPHCAYGRVIPQGERTWLQYWLWYYDNPKTFLGKGRHQGDWELVQIGLGKGDRPELVTCSQHRAGETRAWRRVKRPRGEPDRPLVFVAPFSHANYFEPRTTYYFPAADHPTDRGPSAVPAVLPFDAWQAWRGRWGKDRARHTGRLRALDGVSPDAPIEQRFRWQSPTAYAERAKRPTTTAAKTAIWRLGKATYPLEPELRGARLEGREVLVDYALRQRGLHRSRHLLVTVHEAEAPHHMLLSSVRRDAPDRGTVRLRLPRPATACVVWASAFNPVGQRSPVAGPRRVD
jgi:hypothetical protein